MIGWYVAVLLKRRDQIKANICSVKYTFKEPEVLINLEDDDYNNLLIVERKLDELRSSGFISEKESKVIGYILDHKSYDDIHKLTGYTRITSSKLFYRVCDRIAFLLGDEFTNEGYLESLGNKYNLTEEQLERARQFMSGNKRFSSNTIKGNNIKQDEH